jgi:hypothetical protein
MSFSRLPMEHKLIGRLVQSSFRIRMTSKIRGTIWKGCKSKWPTRTCSGSAKCSSCSLEIVHESLVRCPSMRILSSRFYTKGSHVGNLGTEPTNFKLGHNSNLCFWAYMYSGRTKYSAFVSKLSKLSEEYLSPQKTQKAAVFFIWKILGGRMS